MYLILRQNAGVGFILLCWVKLHGGQTQIFLEWSCACKPHAHVRMRAPWACSWSFHEHALEMRASWACAWKPHGHTLILRQYSRHILCGESNNWFFMHYFDFKHCSSFILKKTTLILYVLCIHFRLMVWSIGSRGVPCALSLQFWYWSEQNICAALGCCRPKWVSLSITVKRPADRLK